MMNANTDDYDDDDDDRDAVMRRFVTVAATIVVVVVAITGGCPAADAGLSSFEGGFDPTRYDAGPLASAADVAAALVDDAGKPRPLIIDVPPFYTERISEG